MCPIRQVVPTEHGVLFAVDEPGERSIDVLVDGRRIWSFREPVEPAPAELVPRGRDVEGLRFEPWPAVLRDRLVGRFRVDLRLRHTLADASPGMVDRMLDHMDEIRDLLTDRLGPAVFVTGGTLLGPVRDEGRLIPHDDDADLAYLSAHSSPADVALEQFGLGSLLRERGYEPIRLNAAHVQVHFEYDGVPDHYVDVFAGFRIGDWWYQHFAIRARVPDTQLLPPSTVVVEGRPEPAPRIPEVVLQEIYGPGWPQPDPAFVFRPPRATSDRFAHWFGDYHAERETWEDLVLMSTGPLLPDHDELSAYANDVDRSTPAGHGLLELGCGLGVDA